MKIIVDKMPQSPEECFYAHSLKKEDAIMNSSS